MIYGAYVLGRDGLTWASCSYWGREGERALSGSLVSSLVSLSDVTFKGRVRKISTFGTTIWLKMTEEKPRFITVIIADQESSNQIPQEFLNNIFSQAKRLAIERPDQVGSGYVLPDFTQELENRIDQEYKHLRYPSSTQIHQTIKNLYYELFWEDSEDVLENLVKLRKKAIEKRDNTYKRFLEHVSEEEEEEYRREKVIKNFHDLNVKRMLKQAIHLKKASKDPLDVLTWIIASVYSNRLPLSYPAPPPQQILQQIQQVKEDIPSGLTTFLSLAELELRSKKSLKKAEEYYNFLEDHLPSLLQTINLQDPPLKELLSILLIGWHPEALDPEVLSRLRAIFGQSGQQIPLYLETLLQTDALYSPQEEKKKDPSSIERLTNLIQEIKFQEVNPTHKEKKKSKLFHFIVVLSLRCSFFNWFSLDFKELSSLLEECLTSFDEFKNILNNLIPLSFTPMNLPQLIEEETYLRLSNLHPKNQKESIKNIADIHSQFTKRLIQHFYAGRINALKAYQYLSISLLQMSESVILMKENPPAIFPIGLRFLFRNEDLAEISQDTPRGKSIISSLTLASAFLTSKIPISTIQNHFLQYLNPFLLRNATDPPKELPRDLILQATFLLQKYEDADSPVSHLRIQNCEFLYTSFDMEENLSPFLQGLLLGALSEGYLNIYERNEDAYQTALGKVREAIELWRKNNVAEELVAELEAKLKKSAL